MAKALALCRIGEDYGGDHGENQGEDYLEYVMMFLNASAKAHHMTRYIPYFGGNSVFLFQSVCQR